MLSLAATLKGCSNSRSPGARIEECSGLDNVEVLVNFVNGQPCEQIPFPYAMGDGLLVISGNVQNIMGDDTCSPGDSPFSVEVEFEYTGGAAPVQCYPCEEDDLTVDVALAP